MKIQKLIKKLQLLEKKNPNAEVWISDEQSSMGPSNSPRLVEEGLETETGETVPAGSVVISFENT